MAKPREVLEMLYPNGGWAISGEEYEGIQFLECEPITKAEYEAGFPQPTMLGRLSKKQQAAAKKAAAEAKLAALGLTSDDLKALGLGGN
jgi:hypothetical protein